MSYIYSVTPEVYYQMVNGYSDTLDNDEVEEVQGFLNDLRDTTNYDYLTIDVIDDNCDNWRECDVLHMFSDTITISINTYNN